MSNNKRMTPALLKGKKSLFFLTDGLWEDRIREKVAEGT